MLFLQVFPDLEYYGGLSGPATGAVAYYCLCKIFITDKRRKIWILMLVVIGIKTFIEIVLDESFFVDTETFDFRVLPLAHIIGYMGTIATIIFSCPGSFFYRNKKVIKKTGVNCF